MEIEIDDGRFIGNGVRPPKTPRPAPPKIRPSLADIRQNVDYRPQMGPAREQGTAQSCVGFAVAACMEWHFKTVLSPLWIYELRGPVSQDFDPGMDPQVGCDIALRFGCASEDVRPYRSTEAQRWTQMDLDYPSGAPDAIDGRSLAEILENARSHKASSMRRILTRDEILSELNEDGPVMLVTNIWYDKHTRKMVPRFWRCPEGKDPDDYFNGGHAMAIVGYDLAGGGNFIVRNTWGDGWRGFDSPGGHFLIPFSDYDDMERKPPSSEWNYFDVWSLRV